MRANHVAFRRLPRAVGENARSGKNVASDQRPAVDHALPSGLKKPAKPARDDCQLSTFRRGTKTSLSVTNLFTPESNPAPISKPSFDPHCRM